MITIIADANHKIGLPETRSIFDIEKIAYKSLTQTKTHQNLTKFYFLYNMITNYIIYFYFIEIEIMSHINDQKPNYPIRALNKAFSVLDILLI